MADLIDEKSDVSPGKLDLREATEIERLPTGIKGFDALLEGGIPKGRAILVRGMSGTGKTVLLNEFIYRGIEQFDQPGVFLTFEEKPVDIARNILGFGWDYQKCVSEKKLDILDCSISYVPISSSGQFDWEILLRRIESAVKRISAKRIAIDSIGNALAHFSSWASVTKVRELIFNLMDRLKQLGVTVLISSEVHGWDYGAMRHDFMEYVADGVINLKIEEGQNTMLRSMIINKLRGVNYRSGTVEYSINAQGITVFPKIPINSFHAQSDFAKRLKTGSPALDKVMGGGVPQGHIMLLGGNTGAGKTLLSMQFLMQGLLEGEKAVFVALEEPVPQLLKTAAAHDWDFAKFHQEGSLAFIRAEMLDISPDKLLYDILNAVTALDAKRVVIDSVSSLESASMNSLKVREFLIQASTFFKTRAVTCYMNYLSADSFGASSGQLLSGLATNDMRLSSIVDGIILLRYVERNQSVRKLLNVLKLRGSEHDRAIFQYEIKRGGIVLGEQFYE